MLLVVVAVLLYKYRMTTGFCIQSTLLAQDPTCPCNLEDLDKVQASKINKLVVCAPFTIVGMKLNMAVACYERDIRSLA